MNESSHPLSSTREGRFCPSFFSGAFWTAGQPKGGGHPFDGGGAGGASGGGFPPNPPFPPFSGFPWNLLRRQRAKRGDVRSAVLGLLSERAMNGYQLMQEIEQRSRGSWRPSPGAVYPALQQLEDEGLVKEEGSGAGRTFSLTDQGKAYVRKHKDEVSAPFENNQAGSCDETMLGLFSELKQIAAATVQLVHTGSAEQIVAAQKVLNKARRGLYRVLEDDVPDEDE